MAKMRRTRRIGRIGKQICDRLRLDHQAHHRVEVENWCECTSWTKINRDTLTRVPTRLAGVRRLGQARRSDFRVARCREAPAGQSKRFR